MSKFTVGRWTESEGIITVSDEQGNWIGNVADILCCKNEDEEKANARLIAAAPEMYELLEVWVNLQAQPTLMEARKRAQELLVRIDGTEAGND